MLTKFIHLMFVGMVILLVSSPALAAGYDVQNSTFQNANRATVQASIDGLHWVHGGTWTHQLGTSARIGLVSMGGSGFTANFDYIRVYELAE